MVVWSGPALRWASRWHRFAFRLRRTRGPEADGFHLAIGVFPMADGRQITKASGYTHR